MLASVTCQKDRALSSSEDHPERLRSGQCHISLEESPDHRLLQGTRPLHLVTKNFVASRLRLTLHSFSAMTRSDQGAEAYFVDEIPRHCQPPK